MLPTKVVVVGAGSSSFGLNTIASLLNSERLDGSHIALVDLNAEALDKMTRLARRLNRDWSAGMEISAHTKCREALDGAEFVISSIEVGPREELWRSDFEIPLQYGVRQPYAENGGPGGFAHAARNIGPVLKIAHDMEEHCPDAWFINFTNPMIRICDAIARYSTVKVVGLCHQIKAGYGMVGFALAGDLGIEIPEGELSTHADRKIWARLNEIVDQAMELVEIRAAGLNHFTWMLSLHDRQTGADLYPLFADRFFETDPGFEPLTHRVYDIFGCFPIPGDEHLCEYLPWLSDPQTKPWEKYDISLYDWNLASKRRDRGFDDIEKMVQGEKDTQHLQEVHSEGAVELVESIASASPRYHRAINRPNEGYIPNLPENAIVEVPGLVDGAGVHGVGVGNLPPSVAELCRRELEVVRLCVDAAAHGDRQAALQCLLLDPVITDLDVAKDILDDYLNAYREYLPQFW